MTRRIRVSLPVLLSLALLAVGAPAAADWLITNDGHRLETRGAWRVEGNVVLFVLPSGGLVSLRASEVDLEASDEATAAVVEAARRAAEPAPEKRSQPVYRLTDADVRHVKDEDESVVEEVADELAGDEEGPLVVTDWSDETDPTGDGVVIVGTVTNQGANTSGNIQLVLRLFNTEGTFIASTAAELSARALPPGETARFEAFFPGIFDFSAVRFNTESIDFVTAPSGSGESDEEYDEEYDERFDEGPDEGFDEGYGEEYDEEYPEENAT